MPATLNPGWEYKNFTFRKWQTSRTWCALAENERLLVPQARQFFWQTYRSEIGRELQQWKAQGWEPVEDIGPSAIKLRKSEQIGPVVDFADILLWVMTLGIALLVRLFLNEPRKYVSYEPIEFRVQMRRLKQQELRATWQLSSEKPIS